MKILPRTPEEAINLVYDILNQGDKRYNDTENELLLTDFIMKDSISVEEKEIPEIKEPEESELRVFEKQYHEKYVAKILLEQQGFQDNEIFFERRFRGSRPDVFAEKENKKIIVECCSCRINKIIDFLTEVDEVWVITRGMTPWEKKPYMKDKMQLFIFKKGSNWKEIIEKFQKSGLEQIKKIQSPIDILMGEGEEAREKTEKK